MVATEKGYIREPGPAGMGCRFDTFLYALGLCMIIPA